MTAEGVSVLRPAPEEAVKFAAVQHRMHVGADAAPAPAVTPVATGTSASERGPESPF